MASKKLKKYLAYYQKVLKNEPENIEARLRLAAIFREMGRHSHAVEEYVAASKLLARDGLPLEAIAACKAVLELDPSHTEIQYFLARLYAQAPEATGNVARIAQPQQGTPSVRKEVSSQLGTDYDQVDDAELDDVMITLESPKKSDPDLDVEKARNVESTGDLGREDDAGMEEPSLESFDHEVGPTSEFESVARPTVTSETRPHEFFGTQDLDPDDILAEISEAHYDQQTQKETSHEVPDESLDLLASEDLTETIELGIFDMESLNLDSEALEDFEFDEELDVVSDGNLDTAKSSQPAVLNVNRSELPEIPLFSQLHPDVFMQLLRVIDLRKVSEGGPILHASSRTRSLFVIVRGKTRVWREVDGEKVDLATMSEGEFFGEFRLLTGRDGSATVSAKTDVELLEISEEVINTLGDVHPEIWDVLWDFYYQRMLNNLLASSQMFRPLDHEKRSQLASKFEVREAHAREYLIRDGDACEFVYLVLSGEVSVERNRDGVRQGLAQMREGEFFGVASSLGGDPYPADVRATRDTTLWCLPASVFVDLVERNDEVARAVQKVIRSRRQMNAAFSSGITPYGELGLANLD